MYASDKLIRQTTKGSVKPSTLEGKVTTERPNRLTFIRRLRHFTPLNNNNNNREVNSNIL